MTATVESAFVLIDRASGPLRGIRRELRETRLEAERTAAALDGISGPRHARDLEAQSRAWRGLQNDVHGTGRELDWTAGRMDHVDRRTTVHVQTVRRARLEWSAFGSALRVTRWPAIAAGVGMLTEAVGGLAGGVVALTPKLLQSSGAAAAAVPTFVGLAADLGVVKLATHDLSQAYGGNERAIRRLTPQARAFLQVLRDFRPEIRRLRVDAQQGLFPGLEAALTDARTAIPAGRQIVRRSSSDLGRLAAYAGDQLTDPGRLREVVQVADEGSRAVGAMARSGVHLAEALLHVGVAAGPMTDAFGSSLERWTRHLEVEAQIAQETGRMDAFFRRSERDLRLLGDTGRHTLGGLSGLMHAATGEGNDLWHSIDRGARRWDDWSHSFEGQNSMRRWFADVRPALDETVGLAGDLAGFVGDIASRPGGAQMLHELRGALPGIADSIGTITDSFGPTAVHAIDQGIGLMADLAHETGPLTLLAGTLGNTAEAVDKLVNALGPLGPALATAIGARALLRRAKAIEAVSGALGRLGGGASSVASGTQVMVQTGPAGIVPVAVAPGGVMPAVMPMAAGEMRTPGGVVLPAGVRSVETTAAGAGGAGLIARARASAGSLWGAATSPGAYSRAVSGGARFVGPAAALMAVMGAAGTQGGFWQRLQGAASAGTFGIIPHPVSDQEKLSNADAAVARMLDGLDDSATAQVRRRQPGLRGAAQQLAQQRAAIKDLRFALGPGLGGNDAFDQGNASLAEANRQLRRELRRREDLLRDSVRTQRQILDERSARHGIAFMDDLGRAFDVRSRSRGPVAAMRATVEAALAEQAKMRPAGAKLLDQQMLAWAREQARLNPALLGEYRKLEDGVKGSFSRTGKHVQIVNGQILTGSASEWRNIRTAITTQTEKAREEASADFTALQQQAVGSLVAMGFSRADARKLVQGIEGGGGGASQAKGQIGAGPGVAGPFRTGRTRRARGGRLPGHGLRDTVPMSDGGLGAPGELVVNRHTERDVDAVLSLFGGSLDGMVARETRPHSAPLARARGGRLHGPPLFTAEGPRWYKAAYRHNHRWARGAPYMTHLDARDELRFDRWVARHHVPFDPRAAVADYDMRGFWKATGGAWHGGHFPDAWKTPFDTTFSAESKYARRGTPFVWWNGSTLYDRRNGRIVFRPHRATGGRMASAAGAYGFFPAAGTNYSVGDEPQIAARLDRLGKALHLHLLGISGYRSPQHSLAVGGFANDPHTRGQASDTPGIEGVAEAVLERFGLTRPFGGAREADHIQLLGSVAGGGAPAITTAGAFAPVARQIAALKAPRSRLGGVPGALSNAASRALARGMTQQINAALGGGGLGGGAPFSGGGRFLATAYGPPWGGIEGGGVTSTGVKLPGGPTGHAGPYIVAVDPAVIPYHSRLRIWPNPFGYRGFFQAEDAGGAIRGNRIDFLDMIGREHQNAWGARAVRVSGRARGGRVGGVEWGGWHGDGVDTTVDRPTLFGAGEAGSERVQITPRSRPGAGHGNVEVHVQVNVTGGGKVSPAKIRKVVVPMFESFAQEFEARLEAGDMDEAMA